MTELQAEFTFKHKIFLVLIVPLFFLICLEGIVRLAGAEKFFFNDDQEVKLEMPTWMLNDQNAILRASQVSDKRANIDWFDIFTEGDGFRVSLIPGIEKSVTNTFSLISYDKKNKYNVRANSLGFRGPELSVEKKPGSRRILIFGDSSSYGWGVNQDEYFTALLPSLLAENSRGIKFEVGNFAIPGDSSEYGRLIVEKFLPLYKPDMVILGFGANDAKKTFVSHTAQVDSFRSQSALQDLKRLASNSALFRIASAALTPRSTAIEALSIKKSNAVQIDRYEENLKSMSLLARKYDARTLVLNLCTPGDYAKVARRFAKDRELDYLNGQGYLLRQLKKIKAGELYPNEVQKMRSLYGRDLASNELLYITSDGCHPNKLGHLIVAEKLAEIIAGSFHLDPDDPV